MTPCMLVKQKVCMVTRGAFSCSWSASTRRRQGDIPHVGPDASTLLRRSYERKHIVHTLDGELVMPRDLVRERDGGSEGVVCSRDRDGPEDFLEAWHFIFIAQSPITARQPESSQDAASCLSTQCRMPIAWICQQAVWLHFVCCTPCLSMVAI